MNKTTHQTPRDEEWVCEFAPHTASEAIAISQKVAATQETWKLLSVQKRVAPLGALAQMFREEKQALAELMAREMGKRLSEGIAEAEKCATACEYYAHHTAQFLADEPIESDHVKSYVSFHPLGVVLAIMPWNFPLWQVIRAAVPALSAGNGVVLKHASNTPGCAVALERLFHAAGFPEDIFRHIRLAGKETESLIADDAISAVTLTGSTPAGKAVAQAAGKYLKKLVLELGGSDPYVVLADADIAAAAKACVTSRLQNAGQSCIAAKRFIAVKEVHDPFVREVKRLMEQRIVGDPFKEATTLGPMAREDLRDELHKQVHKTIEQGAMCLLGGEIPDREGWFYPPTLLTGVRPGMVAFDEELFGPAAAVIMAADEDEAIALANQTSFGLGAAVFTGDVARGERIARDRLNAGCCAINDFVRSDPRLPFGGIKHSGYGRELSFAGIHEFVNRKTVMVS